MAMSKRTKEKESRHVRLYHWFLKSEAWRSLSPNARALYVEIVARYNGSNNGRIPFSVREAAEALHIGKNAASTAFSELQDRGFLVIAKRSAFSLKTKTATEWRLTEFPCDVTNAISSREFMRWSPEKQNTVPNTGLTVPVAGQYGTCSGAVVAKKSRNSTCGGTVNDEKPDPRSSPGYTYSIPGGYAPKERARSSPKLPWTPPQLSEITQDLTPEQLAAFECERLGDGDLMAMAA
jgi:DNA-binding transcriptional regulator YhcF (GntR family)